MIIPSYWKYSIYHLRLKLQKLKQLPFFVSQAIYIESQSISIWGYGTLRTDCLKSRISMTTNHRPLFILYRFRWRVALRVAFPPFVIFLQKWKKGSSSGTFEIDIFLFGIRRGEITRGDFPSKPLGNAGSAARCQQSVRYRSPVMVQGPAFKKESRTSRWYS